MGDIEAQRGSSLRRPTRSSRKTVRDERKFAGNERGRKSRPASLGMTVRVVNGMMERLARSRSPERVVRSVFCVVN